MSIMPVHTNDTISNQFSNSQRITTDQAEQILDAQIFEMQTLEEEKKAASAEVDVVREELTRTAKEVQRMGRERDREEARAKEAREGAEKGDRGVDELCRWSVRYTPTTLNKEFPNSLFLIDRYTSAISVYKNLNGIKSIKPLSDTEIVLEYLVPSGSQVKKELTDGGDAIKLKLQFDPSTKMLAHAEVRPTTAKNVIRYLTIFAILRSY
jgi:hypothetical protein